MDARLCKRQSGECNRLSKLAAREAEAQVLRNISQSWTRLAGQIDRYQAIVRDGAREQNR